MWCLFAYSTWNSWILNNKSVDTPWTDQGSNWQASDLLVTFQAISFKFIISSFKISPYEEILHVLQWKQKLVLEQLNHFEFLWSYCTRWILLVEVCPDWQCSQCPRYYACKLPSAPNIQSKSENKHKHSSHKLSLPWRCSALCQDPVQLCPLQCQRCLF